MADVVECEEADGTYVFEVPLDDEQMDKMLDSGAA